MESRQPQRRQGAHTQQIDDCRKIKFDTMVEKGTWNAPTAEEKIVALEAKFNSTMKSLN